jgi:hypothetical protein
MFALLKVDQARGYAAKSLDLARRFDPTVDESCAATADGTQICEADSRFYDCACSACQLSVPCDSNTDLLDCACPLLKNASEPLLALPALLGRPIFTMGGNPYMRLDDFASERHVAIIKADYPHAEVVVPAVSRGFLVRSRGSIVVPGTEDEATERLDRVLATGSQIVSLDSNAVSGSQVAQWETWFAAGSTHAPWPASAQESSVAVAGCNTFWTNRTVDPTGSAPCFCDPTLLFER